MRGNQSGYGLGIRNGGRKKRGRLDWGKENRREEKSKVESER